MEIRNSILNYLEINQEKFKKNDNVDIIDPKIKKIGPIKKEGLNPHNIYYDPISKRIITIHPDSIQILNKKGTNIKCEFPFHIPMNSVQLVAVDKENSFLIVIMTFKDVPKFFVLDIKQMKALFVFSDPLLKNILGLFFINKKELSVNEVPIKEEDPPCYTVMYTHMFEVYQIKDKIIKANEITKELPGAESKKKIKEDVKNRMRQEEYENTLNLITFPVPEYKDISKSFPLKGVKPIKIHENGFMAGIDPKFYEFLPNTRQAIDFTKMAGLYENKEQLDQIDAEQLLGLSLAKYKEYDQKLDQFVNIAQRAQFNNGEEQNEVMEYLQKKKDQIHEDEQHFKDIVCHLETIKTVKYGDKTEVEY